MHDSKHSIFDAVRVGPSTLRGRAEAEEALTGVVNLGSPLAWFDFNGDNRMLGGGSISCGGDKTSILVDMRLLRRRFICKA